MYGYVIKMKYGYIWVKIKCIENGIDHCMEMLYLILNSKCVEVIV